jgi:hypothetical protein
MLQMHYYEAPVLQNQNAEQHPGMILDSQNQYLERELEHLMVQLGCFLHLWMEGLRRQQCELALTNSSSFLD